MRRQENAQLVKLVVQLREMHHRGLRVHHVDAADDGPGVGIAEAAVRISADAGGKGEIRRPQWRAVAPLQIQAGSGMSPPSLGRRRAGPPAARRHSRLRELRCTASTPADRSHRTR